MPEVDEMEVKNVSHSLEMALFVLLPVYEGMPHDAWQWSKDCFCCNLHLVGILKKKNVTPQNFQDRGRY